MRLPCFMSAKFCNFTVFKLVNTKLVYKSYISNDNLFFPPNLGDFILADAPARLISDIVDLMDPKEIHDSYSKASGRQLPITRQCCLRWCSSANEQRIFNARS